MKELLSKLSNLFNFGKENRLANQAPAAAPQQDAVVETDETVTEGAKATTEATPSADKAPAEADKNVKVKEDQGEALTGLTQAQEKAWEEGALDTSTLPGHTEGSTHTFEEGTTVDVGADRAAKLASGEASPLTPLVEDKGALGAIKTAKVGSAVHELFNTNPEIKDLYANIQSELPDSLAKRVYNRMEAANMDQMSEKELEDFADKVHDIVDEYAVMAVSDEKGAARDMGRALAKLPRATGAAAKMVASVGIPGAIEEAKKGSAVAQVFEEKKGEGTGGTAVVRGPGR